MVGAPAASTTVEAVVLHHWEEISRLLGGSTLNSPVAAARRRVSKSPAAHSADPSADQAAAVAPARALDALRSALESRLPPLLARHLALVDVLAADAMSNGAAGQVQGVVLLELVDYSVAGTLQMGSCCS